MANRLSILHALILTTLISTVGVSRAGSPAVGMPLTQVSIANAGELIIQDDASKFSKWDTRGLRGKIRTIQHIAGRSKAKAINDPFIEALKGAKLDTSVYQTTTIVNLDEAIFGTQTIVANKIKKNKERFPEASFVIDEIGSVKASWELASKGSAIIVLDETGEVMFFKDGKLTQHEIDELITTLKIETARLSTLSNTANIKK